MSHVRDKRADAFPPADGRGREMDNEEMVEHIGRVEKRARQFGP